MLTFINNVNKGIVIYVNLLKILFLKLLIYEIVAFMFRQHYDK